MKLTIEELRKVYLQAKWKEAASDYSTNTDEHDAALLALARFVAERQRAVGPTEEMLRDANRAYGEYIATHMTRTNPWNTWRSLYRAMSAVAPLVVPE